RLIQQPGMNGKAVAVDDVSQPQTGRHQAIGWRLSSRVRLVGGAGEAEPRGSSARFHEPRPLPERIGVRSPAHSFPSYSALSFATTDGSASVVVSPRARPSAMSFNSRRMILPERVLGRSALKRMSSGRAMAPILCTT